MGCVGHTSANEMVLIVAARPISSHKPAYKFVAYNCTVNNIGTKSRPVGYNSWELRDTQEAFMRLRWLST
jgi:hypothetical protein